MIGAIASERDRLVNETAEQQHTLAERAVDRAVSAMVKERSLQGGDFQVASVEERVRQVVSPTSPSRRVSPHSPLMMGALRSSPVRLSSPIKAVPAQNPDVGAETNVQLGGCSVRMWLPSNQMREKQPMSPSNIIKVRRF
eukprot:TRINITY_DN10057_c0_g1_i1.p1 TRINITY_DN10057_c0_g1~~TRINITY_DN10057_c0_g1_i1.p1  ORF type:complete len:140 (-),score=19.15 TRINITY_DN10057_c0_g1_i1:36-455(-)